MQVIFLVQVGFWDTVSEQPTDQYLETLDKALAAGLRQLIVLTVPTKVGTTLCRA